MEWVRHMTTLKIWMNFTEYQREQQFKHRKMSMTLNGNRELKCPKHWDYLRMQDETNVKENRSELGRLILSPWEVSMRIFSLPFFSTSVSTCRSSLNDLNLEEKGFIVSQLVGPPWFDECIWPFLTSNFNANFWAARASASMVGSHKIAVSASNEVTLRQDACLPSNLSLAPQCHGHKEWATTIGSYPRNCHCWLFHAFPPTLSPFLLRRCFCAPHGEIRDSELPSLSL